MGTTTPRLGLYKPAPGDAATTYDTEFPANMDTLDNATLATTLTTQGDLFVRGASDVQRLAAGTSGQVLTANGAGALPSYQAVGGISHPGYATHARFLAD